MKDVDYNPMYDPGYVPSVMKYGSSTVYDGKVEGQGDTGSRTLSYGTIMYEGEVLGQGDTGSRTLSYGSGVLPEQSGGNIPELTYGGPLGGYLGVALVGGLIAMTIPWLIMYFVTRAACKSAMGKKK